MITDETGVKIILVVFGLLGVVAGFYWDSYQLMACANVPLVVAFLGDNAEEETEYE